MRKILVAAALPFVFLCSSCDTNPDRNGLAPGKNPGLTREKFGDDDLIESPGKPPSSAFQLTEGENGRIQRMAANGGTVWSTPLKHYVGGVRPPHLLYDGRRVYVSGMVGGVTALDAKSGKILWHSDGPGERMCLHGDLLLAAECGGSPAITANGRWFVARSTATGKEVFKTKLPPEIDDAIPIRRCAGMYLVEQNGMTTSAILIDDKGQIRLRFNKYLIDARSAGDDVITLMESGVSRLSLKNETKWTVPFKQSSGDGGRIRQLASGDLIAYHFDPISDSGVGVMRLDPISGDVRWKVFCKPLGVSHSKYKHEARIGIENNRLKVTSVGSGGRFDEFLDLHSGKLIRRDTDK